MNSVQNPLLVTAARSEGPQFHLGQDPLILLAIDFMYC
jgi:hypothetical protein